MSKLILLRFQQLFTGLLQVAFGVLKLAGLDAGFWVYKLRRTNGPEPSDVAMYELLQPL
jgi:hypothetical protein